LKALPGSRSRNISAALLGAVLLAGCSPNSLFPNAQFPNPTPNTTTNNLANGLSTTSTSDGAQGQCVNIDPSSPQRLMCINCYNSILAQDCPGQTSPSSCVDPTIQQTFTNLVNLCIANSVTAGFTCTQVCPGTQVLNPASCTCAAPSPAPGQQSVINLIDVGQTDFGPPIMNAALPIPIPASSPTPPAQNCTLTAPIPLSVTNRGGSAFFSNNYNVTGFAAPSPNPAPGGFSSFSIGATVPADGTVTGTAANAYTIITASSSATVGGAGATLQTSEYGVIGGPAVVASLTAAEQAPFGTAITNIKWITVTNSTGSNQTWISDPSMGRILRAAAPSTTTTAVVDPGINGLANLGGVASDQSGGVYYAYWSGGNLNIGNGSSLYQAFGLGQQTVGGMDLMSVGAFNAQYITPFGGSAVAAAQPFNFYVGFGPYMTALCNFDDTFTTTGPAGTVDGPCSGLAYPTAKQFYMGASRTISDVKRNHLGNIYMTDSQANQVLALCYNTKEGDLCATTPGTSHCTTGACSGSIIAGSGAAGDAGDGGAAKSAKLAFPAALAITKAYSDDYVYAGTPASDGVGATGADNNIALVEPSQLSNPYGSVVRMICGNPSSCRTDATCQTKAVTSSGMCSGNSAGNITTIAGTAGAITTGNSGTNALVSARQMTFAQPGGIAVDQYRNLYVSSGNQCITPQPTPTPAAPAPIDPHVSTSCETPAVDDSIREIHYSGSSGMVGGKFTVTDSNGLVSNYCMRVQMGLECDAGACVCLLGAPVNQGYPFWQEIPSTASCP
jgi:hypothetical protein